MLRIACYLFLRRICNGHFRVSDPSLLTSHVHLSGDINALAMGVLKDCFGGHANLLIQNRKAGTVNMCRNHKVSKHRFT